MKSQFRRQLIFFLHTMRMFKLKSEKKGSRVARILLWKLSSDTLFKPVIGIRKQILRMNVQQEKNYFFVISRARTVYISIVEIVLRESFNLCAYKLYPLFLYILVRSRIQTHTHTHTINNSMLFNKHSCITKHFTISMKMDTK